MPLFIGRSKGTVGKNVSKLMDEGYKQAQALAIAYSHAGKGKKKKKKRKH